ncbi:hypothetical protein [Candidatus Magnetomonas plexicatena]|uniref:hypothetical protein n=1 Tax=Candidatus Magnetomonas plexicatena TaxID=2552947 RepID=UPI001C78AC3A|nr:hypothetical protein E2O03_002950 [Nitrospirales bacterium LBB_01]QWR78404.1 hypothetical protein E2O03_013330 [Nitrospirales bacterium LBB_01]
MNEKLYSANDFDFLDTSERDIAASLVNFGNNAATHATVNNGVADMMPDDELIKTVVTGLYKSFFENNKK